MWSLQLDGQGGCERQVGAPAAGDLRPLQRDGGHPVSAVLQDPVDPPAHHNRRSDLPWVITRSKHFGGCATAEKKRYQNTEKL